VGPGKSSIGTDPGPGAQSRLLYRPDIDGLRAISVAAVVLFHVQVPGFTGGYIGVDVFFVISGYLITLLLSGSSRDCLGQQLTRFYIRRGRRILPALFAVLIVATIVAMLLLLPSDLIRYGKNLAWTSVLLANVGAWTDGGYFSGGPSGPLQHLWSIAVEEQFYLVYPILLFLVTKYLSRHVSRFFLVAAASSLAICVWASFYKPSINFYFVPFRGWELLLGAAIATSAVGQTGSRIADELLAALSLAVLVLVVYLYDSKTRYPGLYAIPPCLAAATLIAVGRERLTATGQLLSTRPLVVTGLISYSLYLWHVPLLAYFAYYNITPLTAAHRGALIAVIALTSVVSWRVFEQPIRSRTFLKSDKAFLTTVICAAVAIGVTGVVLFESDGFPRRLPTAVALLAESGVALHRDAQKCSTLPLSKIESGELCKYGSTDANRPKVVVWGDSHALVLLPAYEALAIADHLQLYFASISSCRPLMAVASRDSSERAESMCRKFNSAMLQAIQRLDPASVVLNAYWLYPGPLVPESGVSLVDGESALSRGVQETVKRLGPAHRSVCVVLDVPVARYPVPYALAMARRRGISSDFLTVRRADVAEEDADVERDFHMLQQRGLLETVDPKESLCRTDICDLQAAGRSLYRDSNHLSIEGAMLVRNDLESCFSSFH
jgi:peptidoglycan/LPS O-acetylase OafA/YrhL